MENITVGRATITWCDHKKAWALPGKKYTDLRAKAEEYAKRMDEHIRKIEAKGK